MDGPIQVDRGDPTLVDLRRICLRLPGAAEKVSHGRPCFFTKKVFAIYGAVVKGDHDSGRYDESVVFLPSPDEAAALLDVPGFFVPAYWGPYGWIGLDLSRSGVDWDEVGELVTESFRLTAPPTLVAQLTRSAGERSGVGVGGRAPWATWSRFGREFRSPGSTHRGPGVLDRREGS